MKVNHWKIIAWLLVLVLAFACIQWYRGFRQPTPNPEALSFADTIRESQRRADQNADSVNKHNPDYEKNLEGYRKSADPDSVERDELGARIEAKARADSIRKCAPR